MTARPILFSGPMVRALLDGSKTQTRRVLNPQPDSFETSPGLLCTASLHFDEDEACGRIALGNDGCGVITMQRAGYAVGDRLWVREAWRTGAAFDRFPPRDIPTHAHIACEADDDRARLTGKLRPGMFMPRWASLLTLIVTDVRVQRLQEISEADAIAEGIKKDYAAGMPSAWGWHDYLRGDDIAKRHFSDPRESYRTLWDGLNAKRGYGWNANPWVVAVTFTVHRAKIDAPERSAR
ncbi:hypothetical protein GTW51_10135 [Aurantimonas aggregata]|uniref:ASCH domain-containing protein n=1 Tax=Aurantimonas aggregata TaxID=2047720 RepID=A0A6L9MHW2_9HYPH|nr:hypothetical protein [Aurantimonas aggregata]NDV87060.1 hypothetical protein [Aurantimonas aggregata]